MVEENCIRLTIEELRNMVTSEAFTMDDGNGIDFSNLRAPPVKRHPDHRYLMVLREMPSPGEWLCSNRKRLVAQHLNKNKQIRDDQRENQNSDKNAKLKRNFLPQTRVFQSTRWQRIQHKNIKDNNNNQVSSGFNNMSSSGNSSRYTYYFKRLHHREMSLGIKVDDNQVEMNRIKALSKMLVCVSMITVMLFNFTPAEGVDCFKCSSRNGSNPACEDPFHNLNTTRITTPILPDPPPNVIYHAPCHAGKKGRDGLFPASACIKLTGTFDGTGETLVVRHCALDSGTLTQDTELARMSHCGKFNFDGDSLKGCVLACPEDACNSAPSKLLSALNSRLLLLHLVLLSFATLLIAPLYSVGFN